MTPERIAEIREDAEDRSTYPHDYSGDVMRECLNEIERLQRYEAIAKDMLLCVVDAISGGGYEMDVEQLADIAVKHGMIEWVAYDPDEHGELPSCDPEPGDMIYWFDRRNMP